MPAVLQWLGGLVALVLFLGSVVVYLRGSKDKGTIETLERNSKAQSERIGILEAEDERKTEKIKQLETALDTERTERQQERETLVNIANSSEAIAALREETLSRLGEHHTQVMTVLGQDGALHQDLVQIKATLGAILSELRSREDTP